MKSNSPIDLSNMESKIIRFFFEHVEQELYEKEIADQAGVSAGAANKYLKLLSEKSLLLHRKAGRMNFYKLNKDEPLVKQMKKTYTLSMPFIIKMKEHIKETKIEVYIYGSAARGEDTEKSDIDLLIIGNINNDEL